MPSPKDTHEPIVKTGPTAGQVRSKNKSGEIIDKNKNCFLHNIVL